MDIINVMHDRAGLPPFQSSDPAEIQAHVIQERERELFLEGQHIYTLIRLQSPFDPPVGTQLSPSSLLWRSAVLPAAPGRNRQQPEHTMRTPTVMGAGLALGLAFGLVLPDHSRRNGLGARRRGWFTRPDPGPTLHTKRCMRWSAFTAWFATTTGC